MDFENRFFGFYPPSFLITGHRQKSMVKGLVFRSVTSVEISGKTLTLASMPHKKAKAPGCGFSAL
jgi:hypothetical protein